MVTIKRHKTFVNFESCKDISDEFSIQLKNVKKCLFQMSFLSNVENLL